jgi:hypothetical protein
MLAIILQGPKHGAGYGHERDRGTAGEYLARQPHHARLGRPKP